MLDEFLSTREVAARLGIRQSAVLRMIYRGRLPAVRKGWIWLVPLRSVVAP